VTHTGYLAAGYGVTFAVLAGYAAWIVGRKRTLTKQVASEERDRQWP
jgi:heme exporter protein CcmD